MLEDCLWFLGSGICTILIVSCVILCFSWNFLIHCLLIRKKTHFIYKKNQKQVKSKIRKFVALSPLSPPSDWRTTVMNNEGNFNNSSKRSLRAFLWLVLNSWALCIFSFSSHHPVLKSMFIHQSEQLWLAERVCSLLVHRANCGARLLTWTDSRTHSASKTLSPTKPRKAFHVVS